MATVEDKLDALSAQMAFLLQMMEEANAGICRTMRTSAATSRSSAPSSSPTSPASSTPTAAAAVATPPSTPASTEAPTPITTTTLGDIDDDDPECGDNDLAPSHQAMTTRLHLVRPDGVPEALCWFVSDVGVTFVRSDPALDNHIQEQNAKMVVLVQEDGVSGTLPNRCLINCVTNVQSCFPSSFCCSLDALLFEQYRPWPPPSELRWASCEAELRPVPWPSFDMVKCIAVTALSVHLWKPPWYVSTQQHTSSIYLLNSEVMTASVLNKSKLLHLGSCSDSGVSSVHILVHSTMTYQPWQPISSGEIDVLLKQPRSPSLLCDLMDSDGLLKSTPWSCLCESVYVVHLQNSSALVLAVSFTTVHKLSVWQELSGRALYSITLLLTLCSYACVGLYQLKTVMSYTISYRLLFSISHWKPPWTSLVYIYSNRPNIAYSLRIRTSTMPHLFWWPVVAKLKFGDDQYKNFLGQVMGQCLYFTYMLNDSQSNCKWLLTGPQWFSEHSQCDGVEHHDWRAHIFWMAFRVLSPAWLQTFLSYAMCDTAWWLSTAFHQQVMDQYLPFIALTNQLVHMEEQKALRGLWPIAQDSNLKFLSITSVSILFIHATASSWLQMSRKVVQAMSWEVDPFGLIAFTMNQRIILCAGNMHHVSRRFSSLRSYHFLEGISCFITLYQILNVVCPIIRDGHMACASSPNKNSIQLEHGEFLCTMGPIEKKHPLLNPNTLFLACLFNLHGHPILVEYSKEPIVPSHILQPPWEVLRKILIFKSANCMRHGSCYCGEVWGGPVILVFVPVPASGHLLGGETLLLNVWLVQKWDHSHNPADASFSIYLIGHNVVLTFNGCAKNHMCASLLYSILMQPYHRWLSLCERKGVGGNSVMRQISVATCMILSPYVIQISSSMQALYLCIPTQRYGLLLSESSQVSICVGLPLHLVVFGLTDFHGNEANQSDFLRACQNWKTMKVMYKTLKNSGMLTHHFYNLMVEDP